MGLFISMIILLLKFLKIGFVLLCFFKCTAIGLLESIFVIKLF